MNKLPHKQLSKTLNLAKQQGMTLLEVLVATGILVVISSMAFLSLDTLIQSKQSLQQITTELNQFNLAQFQLQNDIQMAVSSNQALPVLPTAEFIGDSQSITLLRFRTNTVVNQRNRKNNSRQSIADVNNTNLIRVRWYVRNDQWYRASQAAAKPLNSNQWQERSMLDLKSLRCSYQNKAGGQQSNWPNSQTQNAQLPEVINCQVQLDNGLESVLKLVPWQQAGWL